jgi:hypothetical protein
MEVKWEAKPTDTGKIAKLQKRVRQRLLGTYGIFLSMSGYSRPALADLTDGERLEVLLLDIGHFEAMVSGKISPSRLLSLVYDSAAFHGLAYTPISDLQLSDASGGPTQHSQTPGRSSAVPRQRTLPPPAGARSAEMFMFSGHRLIYWVLTGLLGLLTTLVALLTIAGPLSGWSVLGAIVALVALVLTIGFARMAQHPMRLIIGPHGIQLITRQGTTYLPWEEVQAVEIATVFGGPHLLIKTADASNYPTFGDKAGVGPRYVPSRAALSLCPINVLRAAPWQVSHALHSYAGGRMKSA